MLAMALKPFGVRSFVGLMKLPAALLTSPLSGPLSFQIRCTIASAAAASRMSTECVRTRPPAAAMLRHQLLGGVLEHAAAAAGEPEFRAELEVPGGDLFAEAGAAAG